MKRLYLTDEQTAVLVRAIRAHVHTLYECATDAHFDKAYDIEEKYVEEANKLQNILDILEE